MVNVSNKSEVLQNNPRNKSDRAVYKRITNTGWISLLILMLSCLTGVAHSQTPQFRTQVNPNPVTEGERFQITYSLNTDSRNFVPPSFTGIKILSGPNNSSSTRIINGQVSREVSYSYIAVANKVGTLTIPGATVVVGNKRIQSNSVTLQVLEPSVAEKQRRLAESKRQEQITQQARQIIRENLYVTTDVTKKKVFKGEQLVATYKLHVNSDLNVIALDPTSNPSFTGFWTQDFDQDMSQWKNERINGGIFKTLIIKKVVLIPTRSGSLYIDPMEFKSTVRLRTGGRRSIFDDFFSRGSYRDFEHIIRSPKIEISSLELPDGAPESFNGAVGEFSMEAFFDKTEVPSNEPLALKINISGNGNLKLLEPPSIDFPPDFEVFDPKIADNVTVTPSGSKGNLQFEYLSIPRNPGKYDIPPIEFTYFDLSEGQYRTLTSEQFSLNISKGETGESNVFSSSRKEDIELLSSDINYIRTSLGSFNNKSSFFGSFFFILMSLIPFIGLIVLFAFKRKKNDENSDHFEARRRTASRIAKKRLAKASGYLKSDNFDDFYVEINKAVWGYLSEKLVIPIADLTFSLAEKKLLERSVSPQLIADVKNVIDTSEMARYAPTSIPEGMDGTYSKAKSAITDLEEALK